MEQEIQAYYRKLHDLAMKGIHTSASDSLKQVQAIKAKYAKEAELELFRQSLRGQDGQESVKPVGFGGWY